MPKPSTNVPTKEKVGYHTVESAMKSNYKSSNPLSTARKNGK